MRAIGDDLVIPGAEDVPLNHYRVKNGRLQFRCIYENKLGAWQILTAEDVMMHLVLRTPVAQWLYARHGVKVEIPFQIAA